jgi:hypothetical protein
MPSPKPPQPPPPPHGHYLLYPEWGSPALPGSEPFLATLLCRSTYPVRRAIIDSSTYCQPLPRIMVGRYHFRVTIDGGVRAVARLSGLR